MKNYFTEGISKGVNQARVEEFKKKTIEPEKRVFLQEVISKIVYIGIIFCIAIILFFR